MLISLILALAAACQKGSNDPDDSPMKAKSSLPKDRLLATLREGAELGEVRLSANGTRFAYTYRNAEQTWIAIDRDTHGPYDQVLGFDFTRDGQGVWHVAKERRGVYLVRDGVKSPEYEGISWRRSPDGKRIAFLASKKGSTLLLLDGARSQRYEGIRWSRFLPDGRFAMIAQGEPDSGEPSVTGDLLVVEGEVLARGAEITSVTCSGDGKRLAYVIDARAHIDGLRRDVPSPVVALVFSPDGSRWACVTEDQNLYLDGARMDMRGFDRPDALVFSANSRRFAFRAKKRSTTGDLSVLFVDGVPTEPAPGHFPVQFSPDGKRTAYVVLGGKKRWAVVDGRRGPEYDDVRHLTFSPDGARVAYASQSGQEWALVLDGVRHPIDTGFAIGAISFSPDGKRIVYRMGDGGDVAAGCHVIDLKKPESYGIRHQSFFFTSSATHGFYFGGLGRTLDAVFVCGPDGSTTVRKGEWGEILPSTGSLLGDRHAMFVARKGRELWLRVLPIR